MSHDTHPNGSPYHTGHCTKCGQETGDCFDSLCADCETVECKCCEEMVMCRDMFDALICNACKSEIDKIESSLKPDFTQRLKFHMEAVENHWRVAI